jgi:uncharacterized protein YndB with AHSA1/START domain
LALPDERRTHDERKAGMLATLESTDDERFALRFQRTLAHPPEKVWTTLTTVREFGDWFPGTVSGDIEPGVELRFDLTAEQREHMDFSGDVDMSSTGKVLRYDRPAVLEYTWGEELLRWELSADGDGGCRLVYVNSFGDREFAAPNASSWHACLDRLEAHLDGRQPEWSVFDREAELSEEYARALG